MCNCINILIQNGLAKWRVVTEVSENLDLLPTKPGVYVLRASYSNKDIYDGNALPPSRSGGRAPVIVSSILQTC